MDKKTLKTVLDTYGVDLGDVSLEIRGNSKNPKIKKLKHMDNISEDDILNMLYEGDDERLVTDLLEQLGNPNNTQPGAERVIEIHRKKIKLNALHGNDFEKVSDEEVWQKFLDNPNEKQMRMFLKESATNWRRIFKEQKQAQKDNNTGLYSDADLQKVLLGLQICSDMDICLIHISDEREKLNKSLGKDTIKFVKDVNAFKQDLLDYECAYQKLQIECKEVGEFEEKLKAYLTERAQQSGGKTLEDKEKDLFAQKRELEQAYLGDKRTYKRLLGYMCDAVIAKNKLDKRIEEDKNTNMEEYYGTLTTCFKVPQDLEEQIKSVKTEQSLHEEMFKRFNNVCNEQLLARQKLKDIHASVKNFVDASYESQKACLS